MKNNTDKVSSIDYFISEDGRGVFGKPLSPNSESFQLPFEVQEIYWSKSKRGTIRGMHFQVEPFEGWKAVWVTNGSICDVVLNLNDSQNVPLEVFQLYSDIGTCLIIPPGFAHGFQALEENTIVNYAVSSIYSPDHDKGIRFDSFGFDWPLEPINLSSRDLGFSTLRDYLSKS